MPLWEKLLGVFRSSDPKLLERLRHLIRQPDDATDELELLARKVELNEAPGEPVRPMIMMGNGILASDYNTYPLILAALLHKPKTVRCLLKSGARTDVRCGLGRTPLHWAIVGEADYRMASRYTAWNASPESHGKRVSTLPAIAEEAQANSLATTEVLLEHGADPCGADATGATPLHLACSANGKSGHIQLLLDHSALLETVSGEGATPLMVATRGGFAETVRVLLKAGGNPNTRSANGMTALHWACRNGHRDIAQSLLQADARVEGVDAGVFNPIRFAAAIGRWDIVQDLSRNDAVEQVIWSGF